MTIAVATEVTRDDRPTQPTLRAFDPSRLLPLAGRALLATIFLVAAPRQFTDAPVQAALAHGVPFAALLVPLSGVVAAAGGMSLLFGYRAKTGAWLLVLFLVPVTLFMQPFWAVADPVAAAAARTGFLTNLALAGGALGFAYFGAGPLSADARIARTHASLGRG